MFQYWIFVRTLGPRIVFPFAFVVGLIGYNIERLIPTKKPLRFESFDKQRVERKLNELEQTDPTQVQSLKEKQYTFALDKNLSDSLKK